MGKSVSLFSTVSGAATVRTRGLRMVVALTAVASVLPLALSGQSGALVFTNVTVINTTRIDAVVLRGQLLDRARLDVLLRDAERLAAMN